MRKSHQNIAAVDAASNADSLEITRKLYRLIFNDPIGHARKIEELLWRRAFYDVVSTAKKLRKGNVWNDVEKALLSTHLSVGVGFYHHLILKLQLDLICLGDLARYKLDLDPTWDPMIASRYYKMAITIDPNIGMPHNQLGTVAGIKNYGVDAVYHYMRCILCSESFEGAEGNLKRIISSHLFTEKEKLPSQRCAARLFTLLQKWNNGTPVNTDKINEDCQNLLYDIQTCMTADKLNPQKNNLNSNTSENTPENNDSDNLPRTIEEYLQNCKSEQPSPNLSFEVIFKMVSICLMSISKLQLRNSSQVHGVIAFVLSLLSQLLQVVIDNLQKSIVECLPNGVLVKEEQIYVEEKLIVESENSEEINNDLDVNDNTKNLANGHLINGSVKDKIKAKGKVRKSLLSKFRRRKRINSSDSDNSDLEIPHSDDSSDDFNSDISENEEDCVHSDADDLTEDEVEVEENVGLANGAIFDVPEVNSVKEEEIKSDSNEIPSENGTINYLFQKKHVDLNNYFNLLAKEGLFYSIKMCFDWLKSNPEIIKSICNSLLLERVATFINLINIDKYYDVLFEKWEKDREVSLKADKLQEYCKTVPLPEDIDLRGLNVLENAHKDIDWQILRKLMISKNEEVLLRIVKLVDFGNFLSNIEGSGFMYNEEDNLFAVAQADKEKQIDLIKKEEEGTEQEDRVKNDNEINSEHPRGKLMRHMGKLWLKAEVRALETRLRSKLMSPYLVVDHEALTKHTPTLKPREATRWLENQLQKGSRFLRAQRPQERLALPLIKGPRPKDKEAWLFFQIIECCHYLTQQNKVGLSSDNEAPVVTLLTGISTEERKLSNFCPDGLAKSAGVNFEHIESFHTKWKTSSKSHG
ncbi:Similar to SMG5: Protein SMG5 (Homo sapiens) [Cotesia congregata]|uniref:Similar to SMG5: Protein SMG5 (Homo sapiens) n=1 Tax=Cotesia congregata TaxID=51543 RepID=A0A8J2HJD8_COTCN|nr:Similar to SMG5: Protein SMG5 (Homo sapiens) [Cotesia congregata]